MNISSVIVQARPEKLAALRTALSELPGIEVHASAHGRLVLTIEHDACTEDPIARMNGMPGVIAVSLVYQFSDDGIAQESA